MKRISTLCAVLISGLALAQGPGAPLKAPSKVNMKQVEMEPARVGHGSGSSSRAVAFTNDFSTPSDWTMTNASVPSADWQITSTFPASLVGQNFGPTVNSTSGGNFAIIDSDSEGNGATQDANITTTNSFDCSLNPTVQVRFENYHRIFYETHTVMVSNDGVNFDSYAVNTTYGAGNNNYVTSPNVEEVAVNVTATAGSQPTVWLRFNYVAAWDWFWVIDDITVEDAPNDELVGSLFTMCDDTPSYALGERIEHTIVPINQVSAIKFMGNLTNNGANTTTNANVSVDVMNSVPASIFNSTSTPADLASTASRVDSLTWSATTTLGDYTVDFLADFDNYALDPNQTNNAGATAYSIVPSSGAGAMYGRDNNTYTGAGLWNGAGNAYIMGVEYSVNANTTLYGFDIALTASTDPNASICAILYEEDPAAATFNDIFVPVQDNCLDGVEHVITAGDISASPNITWVTLKFNTPITLTAGKAYVAAINHYGGTEEVVLMNGGVTTRGAATVFIYDPTATSGGPWFYMTSKPMIRMNLDNTIGVNETENYNLTLFQNRPNPTNGTTSIAYTLETASDVNFTMVDLTGKVVYSNNFGTMNAGQHNIDLNATDFAAGVYYYTLTAGAEKVTLKMVVTE